MIVLTLKSIEICIVIKNQYEKSKHKNGFLSNVICINIRNNKRKL